MGQFTRAIVKCHNAQNKNVTEIACLFYQIPKPAIHKLFDNQNIEIKQFSMLVYIQWKPWIWFIEMFLSAYKTRTKKKYYLQYFI